MSVTVDQQVLPAAELGLKTVGQVLGHLQRENRLVVQILIDGQEPEVHHLRTTALAGKTVYIETADPRELAVEVLDNVGAELLDSDRLRADAADLLQRNQTARAMEQLGGCLRIWQHAEESVVKTAELLRIDLNTLHVEGRPLAQTVAEFSEQLKLIKLALEQRDFVTLSDVLLYEMEQCTGRWRAALDEIRGAVTAIR